MLSLYCNLMTNPSLLEVTNHYHTSLKVLVENLFIYSEYYICVVGCGSVVGRKFLCPSRLGIQRGGGSLW